MAVWPRGKAKVCKTLILGSNPCAAFIFKKGVKFVSKDKSDLDIVEPLTTCGTARECCEHNIQCSMMVLHTGETICAICAEGPG